MRWMVGVAFIVLCVLSATSWVIPEAMQVGLPPLERQGVVFGAIGLIAVLIGHRGARLRIGGKVYTWLALASLGLFGVPDAVAEYAGSSVPALSRAALYAMVPVVVGMVVAAGSASEAEARGARMSLIPALIGLGGLLLVLPLEFSGSVRGWIMLTIVCAAVVLMGMGSVWLHRLLGATRFGAAVAVVGLANAAFLLLWSAVHEEMVWPWRGLVSAGSLASLVDAVEILLILWLVGKMTPVRFAARYFAIPLLILAEGYVLERPELTVRLVSGMVLLGAGAGMLLFFKADKEETVLSLR